MHYVLIEILKEHYTRITVSGALNECEYLKLHDNIVRVSEHLSNARLLLDVRRVRLLVDPLLPLSQIQAVSGEVLNRIRKLAVLYRRQCGENAFKAEDAIIGRGLNAKFFFDRALAVEWLKGEG